MRFYLNFLKRTHFPIIIESAYPNPGTRKLNCKLHLVEPVCKTECVDRYRVV